MQHLLEPIFWGETQTFLSPEHLKMIQSNLSPLYSCGSILWVDGVVEWGFGDWRVAMEFWSMLYFYRMCVFHHRDRGSGAKKERVFF